MNEEQQLILEKSLANLVGATEPHTGNWRWLDKNEMVVYTGLLGPDWPFVETRKGSANPVRITPADFETAAEACKALRDLMIKSKNNTRQQKLAMITALAGTEVKKYTKFGTREWLTQYTKASPQLDAALDEIDYQSALLRFKIDNLDLLSNFALAPDAAKRERLIYSKWVERSQEAAKKSGSDEELTKLLDEAESLNAEAAKSNKEQKKQKKKTSEVAAIPTEQILNVMQTEPATVEPIAENELQPVVFVNTPEADDEADKVNEEAAKEESAVIDDGTIELKDSDIPYGDNYPKRDTFLLEQNPIVIRAKLLQLQPAATDRSDILVGLYEETHGQIIRAAEALKKSRNSSVESIKRNIATHQKALSQTQDAIAAYNRQLEKVNSANYAKEILRCLDSGFWTDPMQADGLLWFKTAMPIILVEKVKTAEINRIVNLGFWAVSVNNNYDTMLYPCGDNRMASSRKVFHPHIDESGAACLGDVSGDHYTAKQEGDLCKLLVSLQSAISGYNAASPFAPLANFTRYAKPGVHTPYGIVDEIKLVDLVG